MCSLIIKYYQCLSATHLLQVLVLDQQQIAQCVQHIKQLGHLGTGGRRRHTPSVLLDVANRKHGAGRVELELLQMLVDGAMHPDADFGQHRFQIVTVHAALQLRQQRLQLLDHVLAGGRRNGVQIVGLGPEIGFALVGREHNAHPTDDRVDGAIEANVEARLDLFEHKAFLVQAVGVLGGIPVGDDVMRGDIYRY